MTPSPTLRRPGTVAFIVPGSLDARSGGYEYDRRIVAGLRARGWTVDVHPPAALAAIADGTCVVVDGLALGTMRDEVEREKSRLRLVALVHLPRAEDMGLDPAIAATLEASERRALSACAFSIVTGTGTSRTLERYGISRDRIAVIEPGTDAAPIARGSGGPSVHVICVAAVTRGKGHEILIDALARVPSEKWALTCAGSLERDPATVERVRASLRGHALGNHVTLVGELDAAAIANLYDRADLFAIATRHETYGMAVAEALARGLPVIGTQTGAIPDLVGRDAGIVVPVGDVDALASALTRAIDDAPLRAGLAAGAARVRDRLPAWDSAVDKMVAVPRTDVCVMDGSPLSHWLALREPADFAARSAPLTRALMDTLPRHRALRIVDLGTGSGSNVRYLTRFVGHPFSGPPRPASGEGGEGADANWLLVDAEPALLVEARARLRGVETRQMNLGTLDAALFTGRDLVTGSALLDLVSEHWLESLAAHCRDAGAAALFALNYNGESRCAPAEPEDEAIRGLMNAHQRQNDKGFGRAAGPDASALAARCFERRGYSVRRERSDWHLMPDDRELQRRLIEGWAEAAIELAPGESPMIRDWLARRIAHVDASRSMITVGHDDLAASL